MTNCPWLSVSGFGAHIKSTSKNLIIQQKNQIEEYPLKSVQNLMIVGGHTVNSTTISRLIKNGAFISFFEPDGTPVGTIRPFDSAQDNPIKKMQMELPRYRYAISLAQGSLKSRLIAISRIQEMKNTQLFYEGEMQFFQNSLDEMAYLVKMDEIRRLNRLVTDMYYEVLSRAIPSEFGFKRRILSKQTDPINAMLSFGYSMLFGNCCVSVTGARLDPDIGIISEGRGGLILDLIDSLKSEMVDMVVLNTAKDTLEPGDFEQSSDRCILSDELMKELIKLFHSSIRNEKIDEQAVNFKRAITNNAEFNVRY
ncbi:MAG: CRISPR-associated endonuclease Cas1 1 [Methanoregula sp. SKADARSKE-2]|nr:MAG: CRISPR-associated endonuclease Cas1 1 [Methanoregula sp. SKADARSKE-2]